MKVTKILSFIYQTNEYSELDVTATKKMNSLIYLTREFAIHYFTNACAIAKQPIVAAVSSNFGATIYCSNVGVET